MLDYSSEEGARIIIRALGMVRAKYIQSCWIKAVRKLKESVAAAVETGRWIKVEEAEEEIIDSYPQFKVLTNEQINIH